MPSSMAVVSLVCPVGSHAMVLICVRMVAVMGSPARGPWSWRVKMPMRASTYHGDWNGINIDHMYVVRSRGLNMHMRLMRISVGGGQQE